MRDVLIDHLELMRYPVADTEITERSDEHAEIRAMLVSTAAIDADLDAIVEHLSKAQRVKHATWEVRRRADLFDCPVRTSMKWNSVERAFRRSTWIE